MVIFMYLETHGFHFGIVVAEISRPVSKVHFVSSTIIFMLDYKPTVSHVVSHKFAKVYDRFEICTQVAMCLYYSMLFSHVSLYLSMYLYSTVFTSFYICTKYWPVQNISPSCLLFPPCLQYY